MSESRETNSSRSSPITQVCQSLSKLHNNAERSYNTTKNNPEMPDCMVASAGSGTDVKLVKVKQAWTASPEAATSIEVVVRRRKKSEPAGELFLHFCVFLPFWLTFGHFLRFWPKVNFSLFFLPFDILENLGQMFWCFWGHFGYFFEKYFFLQQVKSMSNATST